METTFAKGLIVKKNEKAPDYVLCNLSVKVDEFIEFLSEHNKKGWVNLSVLVGGKTGKPYAKLDTYEPKEQEQKAPAPAPDSNQDDLPF